MTNPKHPVFALVALAAALVMYGVGPTDGASRSTTRRPSSASRPSKTTALMSHKMRRPARRRGYTTPASPRESVGHHR